MDWASIILAAVSGALAALGAQWLVGTRKTRRFPYGVVFVVAFSVLNVIGKQTAIPQIRLWQIDRDLQTFSLYREIGQRDPAAYEQIRAALRDGMQRGEGKAVLVARVQGMVRQLMPGYLARASDAALLTYSQSVASMIELINRRDPIACYRFAFLGAPLDITEYVDDQQWLVGELDAMAVVVKSEQPRAEIDGTVAEARLASAFRDLYSVYGTDVALFDQAELPATAQAKMCTMLIALYRRLGTLPPHESGPALRLVLAHK